MKFFIILILFIASDVSGQKLSKFTIDGRLITKHSKSAIPYASIDYSEKFGVLSDSIGRFKITNIEDSSLRLKFSALGYQSTDTVIRFRHNSEFNFTWEIDVPCKEINEASALSDLANKKVLFILQGGIAPLVYKSQSRLTKKFGVHFLELGCIIVDHFDCIAKYNQTVADFLYKKYGSKWRKNLDARILGVTI